MWSWRCCLHDVGSWLGGQEGEGEGVAVAAVVVAAAVGAVGGAGPSWS